MADINFDCPHCGQNLDAPDDMAGMEIACPSCDAGILIPALKAEVEGVVDKLPEDLEKGSTMRLEIPKDQLPPPPHKRIVQIKRKPH